MVRFTCLFLLMACSAAIATAEAIPHPMLVKLESRAEELFREADSDGNGVLEANERTHGDGLARTAIEMFVKDHTINVKKKPMQAIPEPVLANPDVVALKEFVRHFESLASRKDASLRTMEVLKHLRPIGWNAPPAPVHVGAKGHVTIVRFGSAYSQPRTNYSLPQDFASNSASTLQAQANSPLAQRADVERGVVVPQNFLQGQQRQMMEMQQAQRQLEMQQGHHQNGGFGQPLHENHPGHQQQEPRHEKQERQEKHEKQESRHEEPRHGKHDDKGHHHK